jgi:microsomal epoxide hydrolase
MAEVCARLMTEVLGYRRFAVQGGDIGASVGSRLALAFPERVTGLHLNYLGFLRGLPRATSASAEEQRYFAALDEWQTEEAGYAWIQGTKPQTLAVALNDSPAGLAAWIVEKFRSWSDCDGDLERCFSNDEILTDIMLYWVTSTIGSSFWPYYSARHGDWSPRTDERIQVPTAYIEFPHEIIRPPRSIAEQVFRIERWTVNPHGGHFAALEQPEALAADVQEFFGNRRF